MTLVPLKPWQQCFPSNYCNTGPRKPPQGSIKPDTRSSARIWNGLRGSIIKCNLEKKYEKKSVKTRAVNQGNKWALRMNLWASCDLRKDKSTLIFGKTFGQVSSKTWAPGGKKKKKPADSKQRKLLSFFLMPACGSVAFLHLWQWTTHCHIRPALGGGQIAILRQDEVSPELIRFPQSLWEKSERKGDNFSLTAATPAHTLTLTRRANRRRSPAKAVSARGPLRQSERVY